MLKTSTTTRKSTLDLLYYHILSLFIASPLPQQQAVSYFIGSKNPPTYQIRQFFVTAVTGLILVARSRAVVHINGKKQLYKMVYWS